MVNCVSVKQLINDHLSSCVATQQLRELCVVTLPIDTIDRRWVDVFIEARAADYFLIHDAGKAANELILHGLRLTASVEKNMLLIASRFGVSYAEEMFQTGGKLEHLAERAFSVAMASALATTELLDRSAVIQDDTAAIEQFGAALRKWGKGKARISANKTVVGDLKQHQFDFAVDPLRSRKPVGISIVNPTAGALSAAERFGFKTKDVPPEWQHVAVETRSEVWSKDAKRILSRCADAVIEIPTGHLPTEAQLNGALLRLIA